MIGVAAALATALLWALTSMLVKLEARRLSILAINAYRATVGSAALLVVFLAFRDPAVLLTIPAERYVVMVIAVLFGMVVGATLNFLSLVRIGLGRAFPISGAYPLGTLLMAALLFDEQLGWSEVAGALVTLAGVVLVAMPAKAALTPLDRRNNLVGVALAVGAAVFWALSSIGTKIGMEGVDLLTATAIRLLAAALMLWVLLIGIEGWPPKQPLWRLPTPSLISIIAAGLLGPALSTYLWMLGIQEMGAARTDVVAATGPIFAVVLAAVILREPLGWRVPVGAVLSAIGIMLVVARIGST